MASLNGRERLSRKKVYGAQDTPNITLHHIIPVREAPFFKKEYGNVLPLPSNVHKILHAQYDNLELLQDPINPIIHLLERHCFNTYTMPTLGDVAVWKNASK
jgi:hypothetical protein